MAADIEFNVRNGMTVGASKHLVLDVSGSLSARGFTLVSGQILSGGDDVLQIVDQQLVQPVDSKVNTMGAASADWNNTHTTFNSKSGYWETAFNWGDHSVENYATNADIQTAISDLISGAPAALDTLNELASALGDDAAFATTVTNSIATKWTQDDDKINNWDVTYVAVTANSANWNDAYSWGDHTGPGYLTDYTVTVHDVTAHEGSIEITESQITDLQSYLLASDIVSADNWSLAYTTVTANSASWDHSSAGYLTSYTETDPVFTSHAANNITTQKITNWDNTYTDVSTNSASWDHSSAGYLTSETNTTLTLANNTLTYTSEDETVTTISLEAYTGEGISAIVDATDTAITSPSGGDVLVYVNGTTQQWQNKKNRASLEDMYNYANANFYSEMSYSTTTQLTGVNVWVNSGKTTALFERTLTYNVNSQLTNVLTRDIQGGTIRQQLTKNLAYDVNGNVATVTRTYSEPTQWVPTNSSLELWLDAADSSTISKDGSNLVAEWQDKSGNDNHVSQNSESVKPAYTASGMSGKPAIDFSSDRVATLNDIDMEDKMLLVVIQLDAAGFNRNQQLFANISDNVQLRITLDNNIGYASSNPLYTNNTNSTENVASDTIEVISYTLGSTLRFSINGTYEDSGVSKLTGSNLLSTYNQIGSLGTNANTSLDGKIGEFIVINSTSTTDRQKAEGYLAHKWGVASKLPADHPWKSYPPIV